LAAADWADEIVVAWGAGGKYGARAKTAFRERVKAVIELLSSHKLWCLGRTKDGHPRFPLYLPADTGFEVFRDADENKQ